jgi:Tfp pilus assembly protein PilF
MLSEAVNAYRNAVEADPARADARYNLAVALDAHGKPAEAELSYRKALELAPMLVEAHVGLAGLQARAGDLTAARESLQQALETRPRDPSVHQQFGLLYLAQGQFVSAADSFGKALQLNPRFETARLGLGLALDASGKVAEGRRCSAQARDELSPEATSAFESALMAWAPRRSSTASEPDEELTLAPGASAAVASVAKASPVRAAAAPVAHLVAAAPPVTGQAATRQPRLGETLGCVSVATPSPRPARQAARPCPASPAMAGLSQLSRGNDRAALELLSAAVEAAPSDAAAVNNLACAQARLGYSDLARTLYDLAGVEDSPAGRTATANRRLLTEMMAMQRIPAVTVDGGLAVLK